ncbi:unnamed protein product [Rhizophagus irregularis]|nr:unnamed protein product [Rhizophagus irregularis]
MTRVQKTQKATVAKNSGRWSCLGNKKQAVKCDTLIQEHEAKAGGPFKLDYSTIIGNSKEVYEDNCKIEAESTTASQPTKDEPEALNRMKNILEICQWLKGRLDILVMANQMYNAMNTSLDSHLINNMPTAHVKAYCSSGRC